MARTDLVVVSNRGPLSFTKDESGALVPSRGAGGLVSSLGPLIEGTGATWVAAAMSDADREAAATGVVEAEGYRLRPLDIDPALYGQFYDVVSNATLWFLHHGLYDVARRPVYDRHWHEAWAAYRAVNRRFAEACADETPDNGIVLVQDYHLSLVPAMLRELRPDVRTVHFSHTPFADPDSLRGLPTAVEFLEGLAAADACGFHCERWATRFRQCCDELLGSGARAAAFVSPIASDPDDIAGVAVSPECAEEAAWVERVVGDRRMILRVDRIELSKNIVRGFRAYELMLEERPEWRGRVVFVALVYPSRQSLPQYQAYRQEVETIVERVNNRFATDDWTPIVYDGDDNFPRSVAALKRYDVLLVNPVRDGLNLVAKEGATVNECNGVLALSREAGAWDELGAAALGLNPFDIAETADVLAAALALDDAERAERAAQLRDLSLARRPQDWLDDQLAAVSPSGASG